MTEENDILQVFNDVLRYREEYEDKLIVMKFGGALAEDTDIISNIARQAAFLTLSFGARVILIHGGGAQIDSRIAEHGLEIKKDAKTGLRITDNETLGISDKVLRGINGAIVSIFNKVAPKLRAIGMAGYDGRLITADKKDTLTGNYTGHVKSIDEAYLDYMMSFEGSKVIPIIYPICHNPNGEEENRLNVNADEVAGVLASRLNAKRLVLCSDVPGVLDREGNLISEIFVEDVDSLIEDGSITGGMIQKLRAAAHVAENLDSGSVVIVDGRTPGSILAEFMYEKGSGTLVSTSENYKKKDMLEPAVS